MFSFEVLNLEASAANLLQQVAGAMASIARAAGLSR